MPFLLIEVWLCSFILFLEHVQQIFISETEQLWLDSVEDLLATHIS